MTEIRNEKELLQALSSLPREIAPGNDVWPQIRQRIDGASQQGEGPGNRNRWWPAAIAASLVVVLVGGLLWERSPGPVPPDTEFPVLSQNSVVAEPQAASTLNARLMAGANTQEEHEYQAAFREFLAFPVNPQSPSWPGMETIGSGWVT